MLFLFVCISLVAVLGTTDAKSAKCNDPTTRITDGNIVMCYWESYVEDYHTNDDIDATLCTHLIYAFAVLDKSTHIISTHSTEDKAKYKKFTALKNKQTCSPKMLLAIGGMTDSKVIKVKDEDGKVIKKIDKYSDLVNDSKKRAAFVTNVRTFLTENNFDGLDLDWEFPKTGDKDNFALFVKELKTEFDKTPKLLLTAAVGKLGHDEGGYDIKKLCNNLHYINLMAYDFKGWWDGWSTKHNTEAKHHSSMTDTKALVKLWTDEGCPKDKLVIGVPLYGRSFTLESSSNVKPGSVATGSGTKGSDTDEAGLLGYLEICKKIKDDGWKVVKPVNYDDIGPYAYKGTQWVGYDDVEMACNKAKYAKKYAGVMVWAMDYADHNDYCGLGKYPLLSNMNAYLNSVKGNKCSTLLK